MTTDYALTTDADGRVVAASLELCDLLDVEPPRLLGRRVSELVHADDRVLVERAQVHRAGERPVRMRLRGRDETQVWVWATTSPLRSGGGTQWAFLDITEDVRFEQRLVELATSCTDVFDTLREGVIVIDREGFTLVANAAAAEFLGVPAAELPGSLARAQVVVVDEHGVPMPRERLPSSRAFSTGRPQEEDVAYRRRDGTTRWLHARVVPMVRPTGGEPDRVVILLEDAVGSPQKPPGGAVQEAARKALTPRERDILQLLAQGLDLQTAAAELGISLHTARAHLKQLMQKLGARSQLQAVVFAVRAGLVQFE